MSSTAKRTLYGFSLSGNTHKIRMALSFLHLDYEELEVDLMNPRDPAFLAINPLGQIPVLVDGEVTIRDSGAILEYLARAYGPTLVGKDAVEDARIHQWIGFAGYDVMIGNFLIRLHYLINKPKVDVEETTRKSHENLAILDAHLADGRHWLEGGRLTIADLAVFPYISLSVDGKIDLSLYKNVTSWIDRIKREPWYVGMPSIEKPDASN